MAVAEMKRKFKLGELLVSTGRATQDQVDAALKRSRESGAMLGETLVEMGVVKSFDLLKIVGQQLGLPTVELRPGLIESADGSGFLYLIMPIRLNV